MVRKSVVSLVLILVSVFGMAFLISSMVLGPALKPGPIAVWREVSRDPIPYVYSVWSQGMASDDEYWYFSGKQYLCKAHRNYSVVTENSDPIPYDLKGQLYNHIGDIDCFNGFIYAPVEDRHYGNGTFVMYFAENLSYSGRHKKTSQSHMPWCAVDRRTNRIYSSEFDDVNRLYVYDLDGDFDQLEDLRLSRVLQRVQGGSFDDGYLYLSCDDAGDHIYIVEIDTGNVVDSFPTNIGTEMEGITLIDLDDLGIGTLHFIDYGTYVYHYALYKTKE